MVRLDAQVSSLFGVKQSEARALIASGEVSVNGAPQREPRWQVVLGEEATVTVGGRAPPTGRPFAHRLLLVHKPRGVLSERRRGSAAWNAAHGRRSGEAHGGAHAEAGGRVLPKILRGRLDPLVDRLDRLPELEDLLLELRGLERLHLVLELGQLDGLAAALRRALRRWPRALGS